ncbi:hypothetical protein JOB18_027398 [Solea senegalensis]|uniref:Uncharacterized protein n=1 Tax=Solea senegalensis TaxID=28829 RepID=A0AAV6Q4Z8_SOLSE|nr:hypothetical protein JOB18_027398 [Solea senegalensis]
MVDTSRVRSCRNTEVPAGPATVKADGSQGPACLHLSLHCNFNEGDSVDIPVGILCHEDTSTASPASPQLNSSRVGIIIEGSLVIEALTNLPQAMCLLFGCTVVIVGKDPF